MLNTEDRIREEVLNYGQYKVKKYVHLCKDCNCEIYKTSLEEKTSLGVCLNCSRNHKPWNSAKYNNVGDKLCVSCDRYLEIDKFSSSVNSNSCKKCNTMKKFNLTAIDYEKMLYTQQGKCAICKREESATYKNTETVINLAVDHCHSTGKVRGLLCTRCNTAIGRYEDNIEFMKNAIKYLENN